MAAPDPAQVELPRVDSSLTKIEALGVKIEIPLPKWAVSCLAAILIITAIGFIAYLSATRINSSVIIPAAQMEVYEETTFHLTQPSTLKEVKEETFDTTTVTLNYFKTDGCVQIVRWDASIGKGDGLWMFGAHPHTTVHSHTGRLSDLDVHPLENPPSELKFVEYQDHVLPDEKLFVPVQGHCWDPHPGAFTVINQPVNQCLVQVWRTFYDGCIHFQYFNPCTGTWDVYPNGAPRVTWTRCVH